MDCTQEFSRWTGGKNLTVLLRSFFFSTSADNLLCVATTNKQIILKFLHAKKSCI